MSTGTSAKIKCGHKPHFCILCKIEVPRIHAHFLRRHGDDDKVREIQAIKDRVERLWAWKKLRQEGDKLFNAQLEDVMGDKKIVKVPLTPSPNKKYFDCPNCFGRLRVSARAQHMRLCDKAFKDRIEKVDEPPSDVYDGIPESLQNELRKSLYLGYFVSFMTEQKEDKKGIRTIITDLVSLQQSLQKKNGEDKPLTSYLVSHQVDNFLSCIKQLSGEIKNGKEKVFRYPSRAQRLCRLVVKLSQFLKIFYSKRDMDSDMIQISKFKNIFQADSDKLIKKQAIRSIKLNHLKHPKVLPKTSDISKLTTKLKQETTLLIADLRKQPNEATWRALSENVLCRLTIFNRRRGGAVEKMTVEDFTSAQDTTASVTEEATWNLDPDDTEFLSNIKIVKLVHKCDNVVQIYIDKDLQDAMNVLLRHREFANVNIRNEYFFAASRKSLNPIRGVRVLEKYRRMFPKDVQKLLTATNLRKHGATTAQVLDLNDQDTEEWADHMGHSVNVHRRYYRVKEEANAILRTGRILTALDRGTIKYYKGKKVKEISFSDLNLDVKNEGSGETVKKMSPSDSCASPPDVIETSGSGFKEECEFIPGKDKEKILGEDEVCMQPIATWKLD